MIYFRLNAIIQEQGLSQYKLAKMTGIRPNTINDIVHNRTQRLDLSTLDSLMHELILMGYTISDLIEYRKRD